MERPSLNPDRECLPAFLVDSVDPPMRDALAHPLRRDLLRTLLSAGRPLRLVDLQGSLKGQEASLAGLHYHAGVLELAELVASGDPLQGRAGGGAAMEPTAAAYEGEVQRVLRVMRPLDQGRASSRPSSRLLSMFRVPGPAITLKLGRVSQPKEGRG